MALLFMSLTSVVTAIGRIKNFSRMSLKSPVSCVSDAFYLYCVFILVSLHLLSYDKSGSLYDDSDNGGSDSGSAGMCDFPFCFEGSVGFFDNSTGSVCGVGSGVLY